MCRVRDVARQNTFLVRTNVTIIFMIIVAVYIQLHYVIFVRRRSPAFYITDVLIVFYCNVRTVLCCTVCNGLVYVSTASRLVDVAYNRLSFFDGTGILG